MHLYGVSSQKVLKLNTSSFSSGILTAHHLIKSRYYLNFTTCFTALVLIRLLQAKLENKYPVGKIIEALKKYTCVPLDANNYQFTYYDEVLDACQKVFGVELDNKYRTRQQIQRMLRCEKFF